MSIVKQIVDLSGGIINIGSDLGKGTEISLSLPLENCPPDLEATQNKRDSSLKLEEPVEAVRRRAKGRKVTIRGFDNTTENQSRNTSPSGLDLKLFLQETHQTS